MSKYDGPSYFKKNHPKIKPFKDPKLITDSDENKKVSWADQENYFNNEYVNNIPKGVETRFDLQQKALDYMHAPSGQSKEIEKRESHFEQRPEQPVKDSKTQQLPSDYHWEKPYRFKETFVPKSLQHLDGWKTTQQDVELFSKIATRLTIEPDSYLLFDADGSKGNDSLSSENNKLDDVKVFPREIPNTSSEQKAGKQVVSETKNKLVDRQSGSDSSVKSSHEHALDNKNVSELKNKSTKNKTAFDRSVKSTNKNRTSKQMAYDESTKQKAQHVQKKLNHALTKPNTGLHRSLSKIIAEDQEELKNRKTNLGSLFSNED